jgi:pyruvate-formate lyase-activating enzyme
MYRNSMGAITENYPDRYLNIYPVSSESIPMIHFYPNGIFLLISTMGCNFACDGCISEFQTTRPGTLQEVLVPHPPEEILSIAREYSCRGITFCLNEPAVSFPTFLRVAKAAKSAGLLVGCSSNGYMTPETLQSLLPYLDFVNIGLKGSSDERYRECGAVSSAPVYRNLKILYDNGISVEVSVMYLNGREQEVTGAAERVRAISPSIPFQVMRFMATHPDLEPIAPTRAQGEALCTTLRNYLDHVYLFNTPATTELDTRCPVCGKILIHRVFFGPMAARVLSCHPDGICSCGYRFPCTGTIDPIFEGEVQVLGGYRSIMGARVASGILATLGVTDEKVIDRVSNTLITNGYLTDFSTHTGSIDAYLDMVRYLATLVHREERADRLARYILDVRDEVQEKAPVTGKPRVYAVLSHPLFPLYAAKPVNQLIEIAGGRSLNRELGFTESKNPEYSVEEINRLDPEVILVSGHFAPPVSDFITTCRDLGIHCRALDTNRVYMLNSSHADGTISWALGLMDVANCLHPAQFRYSLAGEQERYEREMEGTLS